MKHIKGDLISLALDDEFDVIVHGCNCFHTMGAGIAHQIAKTFKGTNGPEAVDRNYTKRGDRDKLGSFTIGEGLSHSGQPIAIVNAYTQYSIGPKADGSPPVEYDAIRQAFRGLARFCRSKPYLSFKIGYPAIGAGLAGGDWNKIAAIIDEELEGLDHTYVEYVPGQVARPKTLPIISTNLRYVGMVHQFESYWDYDIDDVRDPRILYTLTYNDETNEWYGVVRRSKSKGEDYDDNLTSDMHVGDVDQCVSVIPGGDLPRKLISREFKRLREENSALKSALNWFDLDEDTRDVILSGEY